MRGHSWKSETMGRNGLRDRNNYHSSSVCCTVIKVCQSFNDFLKSIFYRICKNVLCWISYCTKEFTYSFSKKKKSAKMFPMLTLLVWTLTVFFLIRILTRGVVLIHLYPKTTGLFRYVFLFNCGNPCPKVRLVSKKCGSVDHSEQSQVNNTSEGGAGRCSAELPWTARQYGLMTMLGC